MATGPSGRSLVPFSLFSVSGAGVDPIYFDYGAATRRRTGLVSLVLLVLRSMRAKALAAKTDSGDVPRCGCSSETSWDISVEVLVLACLNSGAIMQEMLWHQATRMGRSISGAISDTQMIGDI